jgi:hypothetical protein
MKKTFGYGLVVVSFVVWGAIPLVPLLGIPFETAAGISTGMLISSEVLWYVALLLLGKEVWEKTKAELGKRVPARLRWWNR